MVKLTSIVTEAEGVVTSVRAHAGHMDAEAVRAYLDGLGADRRYGDVVSFWHVDLYSDVGDPVGDPTRWICLDEGWATYDP